MRVVDKTINKSDIKGNPTQNGWYICKYIHASWTHYLDEDGYTDADYRIDNCWPMLLYWEDNLWLENPRGYKYVKEKYILDWMRVPDDFNFFEQHIKVNIDR